MIYITVQIIFAFLANQSNKIKVNNVDRSYYVAQKGNPTTLIVYWHRTGGTSDEFLVQPWYTLMTDALVASPDSILTASRFEWYLVSSTDLSDVNLFDSILSEIKVDKVYVAGFSAGGIMASYLAFLRADKILKAGIMSGGFTYSQNYNNVQSIPKVLIYSGGPTDVIAITNFTVSTNIFLESVKYTNSDIYVCAHKEGHTIAPVEAGDIYYFFADQPGNISKSCTSYSFKYSIKPKQTSDASEWSEYFMFYILLPLMFFADHPF
eukprot:NODE_208_length_14728_cov_0.400164.p6 type:complete len:265 gc:universal NODE_208_length_14728_cov_0.400164:9109-9903(+)